MISSIISRLVILLFGTLYPAYASYKAVRTKNVKEYVKWMMYWIVFALFTCAETFTDVFCSFWFPFYYEFKVILVIWLLSPATKGSSILYRKFVHPMLTKREQEIDEYIAKAKEQGYHTVLTLGSKGVNYATTVIMQTAIKGGGGLVNQLRRSYSLSDISADMDALAEMNRIKALPEDELDIADTPLPKDARLRRSRGYSPRRSASGSGRVDMYFPEVDVNVRQRGSRPREAGIPLSHIRSNEDVSSGYSSAEMLYSGHPPVSEAQEPLVRTSSVGSSRVTRTKVARGGAGAGAVPKRPTAAEEWSESEESDTGMQEEHFYDVAPTSEPSPHAGSDFKSHVPVAVEGEPVIPTVMNDNMALPPTEGNEKFVETVQDTSDSVTEGLEDKRKDNPVLVSEDNEDFVDATESATSNSTVAFMEEKTGYLNEEVKGEIGVEHLPDDKSALEQGTVKGEEITRHVRKSEEPVDADVVPCTNETDAVAETKKQDATSLPTPSQDVRKAEEPVVADIGSCNSEADVTAETRKQDVTSLPTIVDGVPTPSQEDVSKLDEPVDVDVGSSKSETDIVTETKNQDSDRIPSQEPEESEFFDTESDTTHNTEVCDSASLNEKQLVDVVVTASTDNESTNEHSNSSATDLIPTTVQCDDLLSAGNISKNSSPDPEDNEFFDSQGDSLQQQGNNNPVSVALESSVVEVQNEGTVAESREGQKSVDDVSREGRAGRYNKHPAPLPPLRTSMEDLQIANQPESDIRSRVLPESPQTNSLVPDEPPQGQRTKKSRSKSPQINSLVPDEPPEGQRMKKSRSKSPQASSLVPNEPPEGQRTKKSRSKSPQINSLVLDEPPEGQRMRKSRSKSPQIASSVSKSTVNNEEDIPRRTTPTPHSSYVETQDVRPSEFYYNQYRSQASPKSAKKEIKSRQDTRFFSRILSRPRNAIASFIPFFSSREEPEETRIEDRMRSSSLPTTIELPPELPPRRRTPDGNKVNIRDMSHSPTRR